MEISLPFGSNALKSAFETKIKKQKIKKNKINKNKNVVIWTFLKTVLDQSP